MSQNDRIIEFFQSGQSLTQKEAAEKFGCWRLSGRVKELRESGHNIITVMEDNKNGGQHARYFLKFKEGKRGQLLLI